MFSPLTQVLMKIFAAGFYRAHSGMLVLLFGTVISYCFFINTLGSVPIWAFAEWNLVITLAVVSNPFSTLVFMLLSLGYAFKNLQYISSQLNLNTHKFLYYSSSSLNLLQQFKSWFIVQFNIFLPLWIYGLFAAVIGFNYQHYILPSAILFFLFILTAASTCIILKWVNQTRDLHRQSRFMRLIHNWEKPFLLLYTYHVFNKLKLSYIITKFFSLIFIWGIFSLFADQKEEFIIPVMVMLILITTHSILIYQDYRFSETFLYLLHNFPIPKIRLFLGAAVNYMILMLPELLWFLWAYSFVKVAGLIGIGLSVLLLFRSLLYWFGLDIKKFLFGIFLLFNIFFLAILYRQIWYLPIVNLVIAYLLFIKNYSNQSLKD